MGMLIDDITTVKINHVPTTKIKKKNKVKTKLNIKPIIKYDKFPSHLFDPKSHNVKNS